MIDLAAWSCWLFYQNFILTTAEGRGQEGGATRMVAAAIGGSLSALGQGYRSQGPVVGSIG